jgi:DNA-binding NarL/FixJ family response regulator
MAISFSVSIMGEERILKEALSIALRSRGLLPTVIPGDGEEALHPILSPDVLILAGCGPSEQVCEQLARARASFPHTRIIVLGIGNDPDLLRFILENVGECMTAADSFEKLLRILETIRNPSPLGPRAVEPDSIGRLMTHPTDSDPAPPVLTTREQEVFRAISAGLSNKEIANLFSISQSTVKNHVHSILTKLHIRRRRYALGRTYVPRIHARVASATGGCHEIPECEAAS